MASFTVLAAVLAAIAALVMFLSGELIPATPQEEDPLSDTLKVIENVLQASRARRTLRHSFSSKLQAGV